MAPAVHVGQQRTKSSEKDSNLPITLVVDDKFKHTMTIGYTEGDRIFARRAWYRWQRRANVGVEHCELKLHILNAGVWFPGVFGRVEL